MRHVLFLLSVLLSQSTWAWTPASPEQAKAWLDRMGTQLEASHDPLEGVKAQAAEMLAVEVLLGDDTIGLDDASTHTRSQTWHPRGASKIHRAVAMATAFAEEMTCGAGTCEAAASHFSTVLAFRQDGGATRLVGVFTTNSLVEGARQRAIEASQAKWLAAIDARYSAKAGLPPVTPAPPSAEARAAAQAKNRAGLAALKAKDHAGAITAFTAAVLADPSHLLARYNLACAYGLKGRGADAVRVLQGFKAAEQCTGCQVRLARAAQDADLASLRGDAAFQAVVAGAKVPANTALEAAEVVSARFGGRGSRLEWFVDGQRTIELAFVSQGGQTLATRTVAGHALGNELKGLGRRYENSARLVPIKAPQCKAGCCVGKAVPIKKNTFALHKVCSDADGAGWRTIRRVEIVQR